MLSHHQLLSIVSKSGNTTDMYTNIAGRCKYLSPRLEFDLSWRFCKYWNNIQACLRKHYLWNTSIRPRLRSRDIQINNSHVYIIIYLRTKCHLNRFSHCGVIENKNTNFSIYNISRIKASVCNNAIHKSLHDHFHNILSKNSI